MHFMTTIKYALSRHSQLVILKELIYYPSKGANFKIYNADITYNYTREWKYDKIYIPNHAHANKHTLTPYI